MWYPEIAIKEGINSKRGGPYWFEEVRSGCTTPRNYPMFLVFMELCSLSPELMTNYHKILVHSGAEWFKEVRYVESPQAHEKLSYDPWSLKSLVVQTGSVG